ncbi:MAG: thiamine-phosphate pyrophosphorylase [Candidatus Omnitrophica bacterium]|nr:thiamine-phosphate pyrophosphorylase [Candidatus Omnitrophota bacterium]
MVNYTSSNNINRIIDANINRAKEGLRVCEEITRFILNDGILTSTLKETRHEISAVANKCFLTKELVEARESQFDSGRNIQANELERKDLPDIFFANIQRVKESIRVLEEFSKLLSKKSALKFKNIRYNIYEIEKKALRKIEALRNFR